MTSITSSPEVSRSPSSLSPALVAEPPSPAPCPSAPPSTPRDMSGPEDIVDGVFRDLPLPPGLSASYAAGMMSFGDPDVASGDHDDTAAMAPGKKYSDMEYNEVRAAQASPPVLSQAAARVRVSTSKGGCAHTGQAEDANPVGAQKDSYADRLRQPAPPAVKYHKPVYGVMLPDAVAQVLAYRSPGTYSVSEGGVVDEQGERERERVTRDGLPTLLPLANRAVSSAPSTPGAGRLSEMNISGESGELFEDGSATSGLDLLASAAFLASAHYRVDGDEEMDIEEDLRPVRAGRPVAEIGCTLSGSPAHKDHPVPGLAMNPFEFSAQQQELVRLQLQHDEARARPAVIRLPKAQFYSSIPLHGQTVDPLLLRGFAPMEVDGCPAPRALLAHARIDGSVSSEDDLYAPPPLEDNLRDDPPDAPRVPHRYEAVELPGATLPCGEVQYSHDIPIRNSAALSVAIQGASRDIPQGWQGDDHVADARLLAGGSAGPPQNVLLPLAAQLPSFTAIPLTGAPPIHFDDPEMLLKGLAAERIQVIFRQPQGTAVLVRIYNGGVPRANNVKSQSDALAEALSASGAKDFILVPPAQAWGQELSLQDQPMTWVVLRLRPAVVRTLVGQLVWSSKKITFLAFNRDLKFDRFVGRIGYYTHNWDNDVDTSIRRTFSGPLILPSIRSLVAEHPRILPEDIDPTVNRVLDSIHVLVLTYPNGSIIANVYCDAPTFSVEAWRVWISFIHTVPFWSDLNPTGTFLRPIRCAGCGGADHPTFMCPFAEIPGWNGPIPGAASIEAPPMAPLSGSVVSSRGSSSRGDRPFRGGSTRGRRGRGRGSSNGAPY